MGKIEKRTMICDADIVDEGHIGLDALKQWGVRTEFNNTKAATHIFPNGVVETECWGNVDTPRCEKELEKQRKKRVKEEAEGKK